MQYELDLWEDRHYALKLDPSNFSIANQEDTTPGILTVYMTREAYRRIIEMHAYPEMLARTVRSIVLHAIE